MCTILTLDKPAFDREGERAVQTRIIQDWSGNSDGGSLVFLDPKYPESNSIVRTMSVSNLLGNVLLLMREASDEARVFVHLRSSTTWHVGVSYTHAFDNMAGTVFMHNGVIGNKRGSAVDSFNLAYLGLDSAADLWEELYTSGETFANIFQIHTDDYKYGVIRIKTGSLFTDGRGNFSTNAVGKVNRQVRFNFRQDFDIGEYQLRLNAAREQAEARQSSTPANPSTDTEGAPKLLPASENEYRKYSVLDELGVDLDELGNRNWTTSHSGTPMTTAQLIRNATRPAFDSKQAWKDEQQASEQWANAWANRYADDADGDIELDGVSVVGGNAVVADGDFVDDEELGEPVGGDMDLTRVEQSVGEAIDRYGRVVDGYGEVIRDTDPVVDEQGNVLSDDDKYYLEVERRYWNRGGKSGTGDGW